MSSGDADGGQGSIAPGRCRRLRRAPTGRAIELIQAEARASELRISTIDPREGPSSRFAAVEALAGSRGRPRGEAGEEVPAAEA